MHPSPPPAVVSPAAQSHTSTPGTPANLAYLRSALQSGRLSDATIKTQQSDRLFPVHRLILSLHSPIFQQMFDPSGPYKSALNANRPIEIPNVEEETLEIAIAVMYGEALSLDSLSTALSLATFGHNHAVARLVESAIPIACAKLSASDDDADFVLAISAMRHLENQDLRDAFLVRVSEVDVFITGLVDERAYVRMLARDEVAFVLKRFLKATGADCGSIDGFGGGMGRKGAAFCALVLWSVDEGLMGEVESDDGATTDEGSERRGFYPQVDDSPVRKNVRQRARGGVSILERMSPKVLTSPRIENGDLEKLVEGVDWRDGMREDLEFIRRFLQNTSVSSLVLQNVALEMWIRGMEAADEVGDLQDKVEKLEIVDGKTRRSLQAYRTIAKAYQHETQPVQPVQPVKEARPVKNSRRHLSWQQIKTSPSDSLRGN